MFEARNDLSAFKDRIRDFLVQSKEFSAQVRIAVLNMSLTEPHQYVYVCVYMVQDNKDLYAEEAAVQRERERQRMMSIPGLIAPNEIQDEMLDS